MSAYVFADAEKPTSAGSPYTPRMTPQRRLAYAAVGTFIGLMTTFPNALTNVNLGTISGSLGLYTAEASWLPALYFGMNASANLTLVKARAQFGIELVTQGLLILYALVAALQLLMPGFAMAVAARIANGLETGALTTLSIYYFLVILSAKHRPLALVIGISLTQFGTPLARLVPVALLSIRDWQGMHCIELAVPLLILAAILLAPLPPSDKARAFEPIDFISIALLVPAIVLGCEILGLGRSVWWHDTPWLGDVLAGCVLLLAIGIGIEANRKRPLLELKWLSTINIARFVGIALLMRLALAEQTFGSVGLLSAAGLDNDQLHILFVLVALAMAAGMGACVLTLSEARLPYQVMLAAICIAASALLDSHANNLTRPEQLYLSQALIGFGTTLFIGPAMLYGFIQMMRKGTDHYVTLVVVFSITQNVGALAGSAMMGSYQIERAHVHRDDLSAQLAIGDPAVTTRLSVGAAALAPMMSDPVMRAAQGGALLDRSVSDEASVLAYDDVFRLLASLAAGTAGAVALSLFFTYLRQYAREGQP
ncbi:MFS transporter [Trinickia sp. EG282A]|uniref:MFS transporter n=1 Tax=Trinickia sp. EG282A TaxID=3237013 RepID=UPI0034D33B4B